MKYGQIIRMTCFVTLLRRQNLRYYVSLGIFIIAALALCQISSGDSPEVVNTKSGIEMVLIKGEDKNIHDDQCYEEARHRCQDKCDDTQNIVSRAILARRYVNTCSYADNG